ncbi:hypothetical protein CRYUN_Cryun18bG0028300 [Craigia yunnanensis]
MVRAPCCDKMGLKKGPWTPEEDQILISYIQKYGHTNWRALPKQAGLLRCGKSCRLRWINYLRPDIKRGNFTSEEEETIIKLHEMLGNRWSAIAAKLPGRTDNEIKNVWHTHLKKRLKQYQTKPDIERESSKSKIKCESSNNISTSQSESGNSSSITGNILSRTEIPGQTPMSPQPSSSENSFITNATTATTEREVNNMDIKAENMDSWECFPEIDESFWSDALSSDNSSAVPLNFEGVYDEFQSHQVPSSSIDVMEPDYGYGQNLDDAMEFWYDLFIKAGGEEEFIAEL